MINYHGSGTDMRKQQYNEKYIGFMIDVITADGKTVGLNHQIGFRSVLWHCFPLFEAGGAYAEMANSIIRNTEFKKCHFVPMNFTQLLKKYGDLIDADVKEMMKTYILKHISFAAEDRIHIAMYNDNFAAMAIYTLLVAGEMFELPEYVETGLEKLYGVRDLFMRCGAIMEYGSNTYTPIDTLCYAEIANHVKNDEARALALQCEERMWVEIATHYHPRTARLAGPHSRAYAIDMVGHPHLFSGLAWYVFGDVVFSNPILDLFAPHKNQMMHGGLEDLTLPNIAWIVNADYHCPEYLYDHAFNKKYPYETEYMAECIPANVYREVPADVIHEYPGVRGRNYTYMTEEFAVGTAQSQFHGGALSESFHISYRNTENVKRLYDTGVIYSRYIFNDRLPGGDNEYSIFGKTNYMGFRDEGRKISVQDKGTVIVSYKPKQYEREEVKSAKLSIMVPVHFFDNLDIYAGTQKIKVFPYSSKEKQNIYINVCNSYFAFIPLEATNLGRKEYLRIEKANNHILISFYNYKGTVKSFTEKEMLLATNGFVCLAETGFKNIAEFIEYTEDHYLKDIMERQEGAWSRKIWFKNSKADLCLKYSPVTEGVYVSTVNKRPTGMHILKADGLDLNMVPLL